MFVVCPMIEENEELPPNVKSAQEHAAELQKYFPNLKVACVHGKLKAKEKNEIMQSFVDGDIDILVSTTAHRGRRGRAERGAYDSAKMPTASA